MSTLYIRDVSDDVARILKQRAAQEGTSLSAYVAKELTKIALRPTNDQITARLRQRDRTAGPTAQEVLEAVAAERR
ncbi:hypothetical protein [Nostocoides sp. Soil756]|jgi:plasmid stability protein|uniref:FitA-like ribbon-helix-helix domain-containing protein n=1 Tax=Nostocoides sp. Soil756 TaxID=1736399 RepID=UPI0006F8F160|nr:hypothetical protein [Tetrasphaera sp. Soil756]KRE62975.1 antitoxin [Tetrasphaera sp. Soil756]